MKQCMHAAIYSDYVVLVFSRKVIIGLTNPVSAKRLDYLDYYTGGG